jgi:hypothetical protein
MNHVATKLPTKEAFSGEIDSRFCARIGDGPEFDLFLEKVVDGVSSPLQESFSLRFRAPLDASQVQSIYRLKNEKLGAMDLFLVPIKKDKSGLYYEAVFNHFLNP